MTDLYEPYQRMITVVVLGRVFQVPENNLLLRQLQFVSPDIGYGRYCWNAECRNCEIAYKLAPDGPEVSGLACRVKGKDGMRVTKLAFEMKYNMGDALAGAAKAKDG